MSEKFSIPRFRILSRIFALVLVLVLCFCLIGGAISEHAKMQLNISSLPSLLAYLLLSLFMLCVFLQAIFSICQIKINTDGIEIKSLFWVEKAPWASLDFYPAKDFMYAWLKTKHCFYLLVKKEFAQYADLEALLKRYLDIKN